VHRSRSDAIEALPSSTRLLLRSTLALPTLASLLALLVHNALDAGARRIAVTLCLGPDDTADGPTPFIECADDGAGFAEAWLRTQEERVGSLAHAATVGGLSVETSVNGKRWSLIRRVSAMLVCYPAPLIRAQDGRTLHSGSMDSMPRSLRSQSSASRSAEVARDRGSVVRVDDLYSAVRQLLPCADSVPALTLSFDAAACASHSTAALRQRKLHGLRQHVQHVRPLGAAHADDALPAARWQRACSGTLRSGAYL
jgi:hypothetical protein